MERTYRRWIFTKSTEYRPHGVLRVGQILDRPFEPASALHPGGPLPTPDVILPEDSELRGVNVSQASELSAQFGLWTNLSGVGVPAKATADASKTQSGSEDWHIERISSKIITPSNDYVDDSLRHGDVPAKLKDVWFFKKRLYMITGVRVVEGARMRTAEEKSSSIKIEAQGGDPGTKAGAGGVLSLANKSSRDRAFESATDFVFAYRLQEIYYFPVSKRSSHTPYNKGETSAATGPAKVVQPVVDYDDFEVLRIDDDDYDGEDIEGVYEVAVPGFESSVVLVEPNDA